MGEAWHLLAALLGVSLIWWIQVLRGQGHLMLFPMLFTVIAVSLLAHEFSQKLVARKLGLETAFKAWGSGIFFSWLIALLGGFLPPYSSTYMKRLDWWYDPRKDKTGIIFAVGPLVSLLLSLAFWIMPNFTTGDILVVSTKVGYLTNLLIVVFNLIPVQAAGGFVWDGKKILMWNKTVWVTLTIVTLILIISSILF